MSSAGEQEKAFHCKEDTMLQRLGKHPGAQHTHAVNLIAFVSTKH